MIDAAGATTIPGRVLAVDHGMRRIGIAISDPLRLFARPLLTFDATAIESPESKVIELAIEWEASDIVVGVPFMPSGDVGEQGAIVLEFIERLRDKLATIAPMIQLRTIDESDSTATAESLRPKRAKRRAPDVGLDAVAAAVILETWLRES